MARTTKNPLDRNVSVRLPVALLHRIEDSISAVNIARANDTDDGKPKQPPATLSDAIRRACVVWLDIRENGGDSATVRDLLANEFADRLTAMLALGVNDAGARNMLNAIANRQSAKESFPWDD